MYRSHSASTPQDVELGLNDTDHKAVPLDLKRGFDSSGNHRYLPKAQGMSGSPIWVVDEDEPDFENRVFPFVGVGTQYHPKRKILSGTDIGAQQYKTRIDQNPDRSSHRMSSGIRTSREIQNLFSST